MVEYNRSFILNEGSPSGFCHGNGSGGEGNPGSCPPWCQTLKETRNQIQIHMIARIQK